MPLHIKPLILTALAGLYLLSLEVARYALNTTWSSRFLTRESDPLPKTARLWR